MRRRGIAWGIGLAVLLGLVAIARAERYAVLIGVDYQGCQSALNSQGCPPGLEGPVNDVEALQRVLVDRYQFRPEHITVLVNQNATKAKILTTLAAFRQTTTAHDFLLVYFSGHGTSRFDREANLDIDPSSGALVPDDFRFYPNDMSRTLDGLIIGRRDLRTIFAELERERRLLVIFDACFSGNTVRSLRGSAGIPRYVSLDASLLRGRRGIQVIPSVSQPTPTGTPEEPYPYKNLIYLSASDETQLARDLAPQESVYGKAHGALTDVLLLGLNGAADTNHDQTITYQELYQFVRREVSDKRGHTPQLLAQTDLDQPVFDLPIRLSAPPPSPGAPTGPLLVQIEGQQEPLRSKLMTLGDIKLTDGKHDLLIAQAGSGYDLYLPSGDRLCSLSTVDEVVSRLTRYVRVRELAQLRNPKQAFNVWLHVGVEAGKTVFMEGERLDLSVKSERAASLLVLNIDPHGFVSAIENHVVPGATLILPGVGTVEPPLGMEYFKLFAFSRPVAGFTQWTQRLLDPASGEVLALLERIKQEQEWAETVQELVTVKRP